MNGTKDELVRNWLIKAKFHEYQEASEAATKLYNFVLSRLPETTHP